MRNDIFEKAINVVYILTNPSFAHDMVKIGYTNNLRNRLNQLNAEVGTPYPFSVYAYYETLADQPDHYIHTIIDMFDPSLRSRTDQDGKLRQREFFKMAPEDAYKMFKNIAKLSGTEHKLHLVAQEPEKREHSDAITKNNSESVIMQPAQTTQQAEKKTVVIKRSSRPHSWYQPEKGSLKPHKEAVFDDDFSRFGDSCNWIRGYVLEDLAVPRISNTTETYHMQGTRTYAIEMVRNMQKSDIFNEDIISASELKEAILNGHSLDSYVTAYGLNNKEEVMRRALTPSQLKIYNNRKTGPMLCKDYWTQREVEQREEALNLIVGVFRTIFPQTKDADGEIWIDITKLDRETLEQKRFYWA